MTKQSVPLAENPLVTHFSIQIPEYPHLNPFVNKWVLFMLCVAIFIPLALCCTYGKFWLC